MNIRRITSALLVLGLSALSGGALAQSEAADVAGEPTRNIWTNIAFGPSQLLWFAAAIALGVVAYFGFYNAVLPMGLRRVPEPLSPGRHRLSAAACAMLAASVVLGFAGFGLIWLFILIGLATVLDLLGGRFWLFVIGPVMAIGFLLYGFLSH